MFVVGWFVLFVVPCVRSSRLSQAVMEDQEEDSVSRGQSSSARTGSGGTRRRQSTLYDAFRSTKRRRDVDVEEELASTAPPQEAPTEVGEEREEIDAVDEVAQDAAEAEDDAMAVDDIGLARSHLDQLTDAQTPETATC